MKRIDALIIASRYGLFSEVRYCIDILHYTPEEALEEWDIPYDLKQY